MSLTSQYLCMFVICLLSWGHVASAAQERRNSPAADVVLSQIKHAFAQSAFHKAHPEYKVAIEGNTLTLTYHPRAWVVYGCSMSGEWSKTPNNETGPDSDGLILTVSAIDLKDAGQEQFAGRAEGLDLSGFDTYSPVSGNMHVIRNPYWSIYCCGQDFANQGVRISCNIEFNNRTDRKRVREAFAPIAACLADIDKRKPSRPSR